MREISLGLGFEDGDGNDPSVAMNRYREILEVHQNDQSLHYRLGRIEKAAILWKGEGKYEENGSTPACAINEYGNAVSVYRSLSGTKLWARVGSVGADSVSWKEETNYRTGRMPAIAVQGYEFVEVHHHEKSDDPRLYFNYGRIDGNRLVFARESWQQYAKGDVPRVAVNSNRRVVFVHDRGGKLYTIVGRWTDAGITLGAEQPFSESGSQPAVALLDDGTVTLAYRRDEGPVRFLYQCQGRVGESLTIDWQTKPRAYDNGVTPSLAGRGNYVVEIHRGATLERLWYSTTIFTDRARWMTDRLSVLGNTRLCDLALPASHDSAMYGSGGIQQLGKTQDLSMEQQMSYGIRYYDLRVKWDGERFRMHHGVATGPDLSEILDGFRRFAERKFRELAILVFGLEDFHDDQKIWERFVGQVNDAIGPWIYRDSSLPRGTRLAQQPLAHFVPNGTTYLVTVEKSLATKYPADGFWRFSKANAEDPSVGALRVFDDYSDTADYGEMATDQLEQFEGYDGQCPEPNRSVACDLFLLSWTLTPPITGVPLVSRDANRHLGQVMSTLKNPNEHDQFVNLIYVDFVEDARVTDVALWANGTPLPR